MDDDLELPTYTPPTGVDAFADSEDANQSSDEDDGGPDWTKLPLSTAGRPVIPKRGEKEYEPSGLKGTDLQQYRLERSRNAMFSALDVERTISSKNVSYGAWIPEIARVHVTLARGNHLLSVGHSAPREPRARENFEKVTTKDKVAKHVELLPEEALYLIERGSMFCWKQEDPAVPIEPGDEERLGTPMTVQQAYAEMIGREDMTLERYQVFSYLKRLGYVVTRAKAPNKYYPLPPPYKPSSKLGQTKSVLSRIADIFLWPFRTLFTLRFDWWKPLKADSFIHRLLNYPSIFSALRILRTGHNVPLLIKPEITNETATPYKIFYNLYKPVTPYRKTAPPPPDFQVVVVDGRTTPMPTLQELTSLFDQIPDLPPPVPRKRTIPPSGINATQPSAATEPPSPEQSLRFRILSWLTTLPFWRSRSASQAQAQRQTPRPNPFQMLKLGKKIIVVAAVDSGMISFFRFGQGGFEEWPMV